MCHDWLTIEVSSACLKPPTASDDYRPVSYLVGAVGLGEAAVGTGLEIDIVQEGAYLRLRGRLDARNASDARTALQEAVDAGSDELIIELGGLEIWDGAGLGVLVGAGRRAQRLGRQLVLTDVQARELRLLRVARVTWTSSVRPAALVG
jgi:anti-anti-sigma factor